MASDDAAQAKTLREWAADWQRRAADDHTGGHGEVAFLMQRVAKLIDNIAGAEPRIETDAA